MKRALELRAAQLVVLGSMTIGEDVHSSRCEFADVVLDTVVCRSLWKIPVGTDVRAEADRISEWCFKKSLEFLTFGGDFVSRFLFMANY